MSEAHLTVPGESWHESLLAALREFHEEELHTGRRPGDLAEQRRPGTGSSACAGPVSWGGQTTHGTGRPPHVLVSRGNAVPRPGPTQSPAHPGAD
ncbi:hypothetical protein [Amycolatopsis plumensis]|uniref:hypothetical protein n=1 Tax=Amycolatopsis plumensis TaxID=236508 RepID=UPI00360E5B9D